MISPSSETRSITQTRSVLFILAMSGFVTSFGAHIVTTNLPSYAETAAVGAAMIGVLIGIYDFAELFAKPVSGWIADRKGRKLTLIAGQVVFILGSLLFLIISPRLLVLVRFIQGLGAAALSTVSITLVAEYFATSRGRAFGIYNAIKGAGYVVAPVLGGVLAHRYGFWMIFTVSAGVGIVALLLSLALPADHDASGTLEDDDDLSIRGFFLIFRDPRLMPVYAVILINMFLVGILFGFLPLYLHGLGYSAPRSGMVVSAATLSYILVQPLAGYLADRINVRVTVLVGLALAATAILGVTFTSGILLWVVTVLAGIGIGTVWTNTDALVGQIADRRQLGSSMGAAQSFKEFGDMVGPLLIGVLTQFYGIRVGFVTCGILALLFLGLLARSRALSAATEDAL